jgi:hypothetical protein
MKSSGLEAIHFRILTIAILRFSDVLGRFFCLKIVSPLIFCRENLRGPLHLREGMCVSEPAGYEKSAGSERPLSQSDCFIFTDKKINVIAAPFAVTNFGSSPCY